MILDTTFVIDILKGRPEAIEKLRQMERARHPILLTTVSIFELWQGIEVKDKEKEEKIKETLENFPFVTLDLRGAELAGNIHGGLERKGMVIDPEDSMISGIALSRNEAVLTRNERHFKRVNGLRIELY